MALQRRSRGIAAALAVVVLWARSYSSGRGTWQNEMAARSADFVICDPATLRPRVVIELDEPSRHARATDTDEEVGVMLEGAGLPVLRLNTARSYNKRELAETILPYLK